MVKEREDSGGALFREFVIFTPRPIVDIMFEAIPP